MVNIFINDGKTGNGDNEIISILNDNIKRDVDLIEQVEKLTEANSLLVQHITGLKKENQELKDLQLKSNNVLNNVLVELKEIKESMKKDTPQSRKETITKTLVELNKSNTKKNKKHTGRAVNDDETFVPNKSLRTKWKYLELKDDGSIYNNSKRTFKLPVDLNLVLYIQECDNPRMDRATAKLLMSKYNIEYQFFGKLIFNLRHTNNFDSIFKKYHSNLEKAKFSIKNNMLCVNKTNTNIPLATAKEWIAIMANANNKQSKIMDLQMEHKDIDKNMIRIVCDSYDNTQLIKLLKNVKKNTFIENNPSKRRNMIRNGGLL